MPENSGAPSVESLVKRGYLFIEDSDWNKADEYFDKALDINPEYAPAYIGKLCVELRAHGEEALGDYKELRQGKKLDRLLGEYGNFQKALRFADAGYRKKLDGYGQKIKESFPKIPQRFTDVFIKGEIARLEKEIADCGAEIAKAEKDKKDAIAGWTLAREERKRIEASYWDRVMNTYFDGLNEDKGYQAWTKKEEDSYKAEADANKRIKEYKDRKIKYETEKQKLEPLAGISCLERMDVHYNRFAEAMKKESTEDGFKRLAERFRSLEGYKDSAELTGKCGKLAVMARNEEQEKTEREAKEKAEKEAREAKEKAEKEAREAKEKAEKEAKEARALAENKPRMAKAREQITKYQGCISAGSSHTVGLKSNGRVVAVGYYSGNDNGNKVISAWRDIVAVAAGGSHTVGLKADGTVVAVGDDNKNQCNISDWHDIVAISAGSDHTVGLKAGGTVVAVGENDDGQCNVGGWRDIVAVAAGYNFTVGLKDDGTVVTTKSDDDLSAWRDIVAISAGFIHTVGLKADNTVVAVGSNEYYDSFSSKWKHCGQCDVSDWSDIVAVAAGSHYTVGLKADGTLDTVGYYSFPNRATLTVTTEYKSFYEGTTYYNNIVGLKTDGNIVAVAAGSDHIVCLKADGKVFAAGNNDYGQCYVSDWRDIGPVLKKGVCKYCGGKLGGLFTMKCNSCGKVN